MIILLGGTFDGYSTRCKAILNYPSSTTQDDRNWDLGFRIIKLTKK